MPLRHVAQNDRDDLFLLDIKDRNSHVSWKVRGIFPARGDVRAAMQESDGFTLACVGSSLAARVRNSAANDGIDAFADDLFCLMPEHPFGTLVEQRDDTTLVATDDRIARHIENGSEPGA